MFGTRDANYVKLWHDLARVLTATEQAKHNSCRQLLSCVAKVVFRRLHVKSLTATAPTC